MKIGEGMVSHVYLKRSVVEKRYRLFSEHKRGVEPHYHREVEALKILSGEKHFPKLIKCENNIIYMNYCGKPLTKEMVPKNWEKQCNEIEKTLKKKNVFHMDLVEVVYGKRRMKNITIKNKVIHLVDFGIWTKDENQKRVTPTEAIKLLLNS